LATVLLPGAVAHLAGGHTQLEIEGRTVAELLANLNRKYSGIESILGNENALGPGIAVAIDGVIFGRDIYRSIGPDTEVCFVPSISGG
jgi:molybdopterin synthase sulfur carrier subunit